MDEIPLSVIFYLIIDLIITLFCYMAIPIFIKKNNKTYTNKEATKISLLNSIGVCIFFILLRKIQGIEQTTINFAPATFYYLINKRYILKPTSAKKETTAKNTFSSSNSKKSVTASKRKIIKEKNQSLEKSNHKSILIIVGSVTISILLFAGIYSLTYYIASLKSQIKTSQNLYSRSQDSYNNIKEKYSTLKKEYEEKEEEYTSKIEFFDEHVVFVIEGYGNYYYTYDEMEQVTQGKNYSFWAYNIDQAKNLGYKAFSSSNSSSSFKDYINRNKN